MASLKQLSHSWLLRLKNGFSKKDYSLSHLNITQFTVILIDNIFKLAIAFFLIDRMGKQNASHVLALVGAIYVIPFLLFSSTGGALADRFSKQRIIIAIKIFEVIVILASLVSFHYQSVFGAYTILFLLSVESAILGPSKYGIIVELVPKEQVVKGNGLIISFTFLAIIFGTFLGSFLTEIFHKNYSLISLCVLVVSIGGLLCALRIKYTPPSGSLKKIHPLFLHELLQTLSYAKTRHHLVLAVLASSYFLFIGAFTQLNIIPYAIEAMHLSEVAGGYLFLSTAMGIAIGSFIYGKTSKKRINLLIPILISSLMGLFLMSLKISSSSIFFTVMALVALGVVGGMYIVPFDAFIQVSSGDEKRGQVIGLSNFLQFVGVLNASLALFIFSHVHIHASTGFLIIGLITAAFSLFLFITLSDWTLRLVSKSFWHPFHSLVYEGETLLENPKGVVVVAANKNLKELALLSRPFQQTIFIVPKGFFKVLPSLQKFLGCLVLMDDKSSLLERIEKAKELSHSQTLCCVLMENNFSLLHIVLK